MMLLLATLLTAKLLFFYLLMRQRRIPSVIGSHISHHTLQHVRRKVARQGDVR